MKSITKVVVDILFPPSEALLRIRTAIRTGLFPQATIFERDGITVLHSYKNQYIHDIVLESKTTGTMECITIIGCAFFEMILDISTDIDIGTTKKSVVVSVPTHQSKVRSRGFNHLHDILDVVSKEKSMNSFTVSQKALSAIRTTKDQVGKTKTERIENLKGAFSADENIVKGKVVFVIDDVTTTGATLNEARRALLCAGARKVIPIAFAG